MEIKKSDVLWSYLGKFFSISANIILLPLVMRRLTDTELGLWYVFASISQIVSLFDFGFNATLSRHMTYAWSGARTLERAGVGDCDAGGERNEGLVSEVVSTCKAVYLAVSSCALAVMLTAGTAYVCAVAGEGMTGGILLSWFLYSAAVFVNLLYGYWSSLLQGIGAIAERNKMAVFSKVVQIALAFALLTGGYGLLGFVTAYAVSGVSTRIIGKLYFDKKTAGMDIKRRAGRGEVRECFSIVWATAWKDGIVMMAQYFSTQANTLICAYFIDLGATSSYGVITQVGSIIGSLASSYFSAYQPWYSNCCLRGDAGELRELTCACSLVYKAVFAAGAACFAIAGVPLLRWMRPAMEVDMGLVLAVCLFYYLYNQHSMFCSMIASSNRILYYKQFAVTAAASVALSVLLCSALGMGVWGLVLAQIASNLAYNNWHWPRLVMREQGIRYRDIYVVGLERVRRGRRKK